MFLGKEKYHLKKELFATNIHCLGFFFLYTEKNPLLYTEGRALSKLIFAFSEGVSSPLRTVFPM